MSREFIPYFEIKDVGEDGSFSGIASVYGIEDLGGDVIDKGAFKKTIAENPTVPILWQHNSEQVIGEGSVKEWQGKILIEGTLDMEDPMAVNAYRKLKKRLIKGLSIGFNTVKSTWEDVEGRMVRHIGELKLWEVSVVTFPALPDAQVTRVKSAEEQAQIAQLVQIEVAKQFQALQAANVTEPEVKATADEGEGAAIQQAEPVIHSDLIAEQFTQATKEIVWN